MKPKGIDKLREKLPGYPGKRIAVLPVIGALVLLLGLVFMLVMDTISRLMPGVPLLAALEPLLPVLGLIIAVGTGISFVRRMWTKRDKVKAELGELAYQRMVPQGLTGVFLLFSAVIHSFVSVRSLPPGPPVNEITTQLSNSFLSVVGVPSAVDMGLRIIGGGLFLLLASLTAMRALFTFGFDYMLVIYLYFPEESEIQNHEIYSVIRHPAYFSLVLAGLAAILARMSVYSLVFAFVVILALLTHVRLEEGELVERFGESYLEYMEKVPGLYVRSRDIRSYLRFLAGRSILVSRED
ncbi:MAG: isoprenylcysteine carboxylmethyltransferase family protein [Candidatus Thorarchaeota archaeon]|nr:MAG: isoprenylcysteine carboxylmethyltransferase family protein [Candidatus Thorarchaeota archaeon]